MIVTEKLGVANKFFALRYKIIATNLNSCGTMLKSLLIYSLNKLLSYVPLGIGAWLLVAKAMFWGL
jgi:hypothetical protein